MLSAQAWPCLEGAQQPLGGSARSVQPGGQLACQLHIDARLLCSICLYVANSSPLPLQVCLTSMGLLHVHESACCRAPGWPEGRLLHDTDEHQLSHSTMDRACFKAEGARPLLV